MSFLSFGSQWQPPYFRPSEQCNLCSLNITASGECCTWNSKAKEPLEPVWASMRRVELQQPIWNHATMEELSDKHCIERSVFIPYFLCSTNNYLMLAVTTRKLLGESLEIIYHSSQKKQLSFSGDNKTEVRGLRWRYWLRVNNLKNGRPVVMLCKALEWIIQKGRQFYDFNNPHLVTSYKNPEADKHRLLQWKLQLNFKIDRLWGFFFKGACHNHVHGCVFSQVCNPPRMSAEYTSPPPFYPPQPIWKAG